MSAMRSIVPYLLIATIIVNVVFGKFPKNTSEIIRSYGYVNIVLTKLLKLLIIPIFMKTCHSTA
jgi:hypothetical protein